MTAEAGVFGEMGGDSKVTFNSCCLEEEKHKHQKSDNYEEYNMLSVTEYHSGTVNSD